MPDGPPVLFFGTYESHRISRVAVLIEGLAARGIAVRECNEPLGIGTDDRVRMLRNPLAALRLVVRILGAWWRLARRARHEPRPRAVVVGYLGHFDVHLARLLFRRSPILLDHMVSLADTATDRRASTFVIRALDLVDRAALRAAHVVVVDTEEQAATLPPRHRARAVVVPVGAPSVWFAPDRVAEPQGRDDTVLRVVFFGTFTPLQGSPVIARAALDLHRRAVPFRLTLVGHGQEHTEVARLLAGVAEIEWIDWMPSDDLARLVSDNDVCLGIFDTGPKALRVVPQKVFLGAAAGCAVITSDTPPQRRALLDAAVFVPPGDPAALAEAFAALQRDSARLAALRAAAAGRAREAFFPDVAVEPLVAALEGAQGS